jgi:hypothetical protein
LGPTIDSLEDLLKSLPEGGKAGHADLLDINSTLADHLAEGLSTWKTIA